MKTYKVRGTRAVADVSKATREQKATIGKPSWRLQERVWDWGFHVWPS